MADMDFKGWTADELAEQKRAIQEDGRYLEKYRELLTAQDIYRSRAEALGHDTRYISELFSRCRVAFEKNDGAGMKSGAEECLALGKIEDAENIGAGHAELDGPGTRIVQLSWILKSFPAEK